ncbi:SDR family oxidoreductase [Actinoplanes couchii]|uniref:Nucleotide-diphosphate-sugar epimerase n=1 Tax=Actinoplanes couchii TaxID=403638 RepID=A0ABQ3XL74_9ACTN|nr:NAD(P)H-binding protein [Actinoplanes couchii]MDR6318388.1 uncharacterized protein YbjT (DUF2867 family) [Actinoplanes couchii]GID59246.1 nucleotide-diphosphate-sugar epimerase [Actinoplanes couchii]
MTILVTGATGAVGRHLTGALAAAGEKVRAVSREPRKAGLPDGVDVVGADLTASSALTADLFDGVDRMFVFPFEHGVDDLIAAAVAGGVRRFVVLSSLAAAGEFPRDIGSASYTHHRAVEQAVTSRTDAWTILRPGTFAGNLLSWAWPIKAGLPIRAPFLHSAQAPIHEADVADAAAAALLHDGQQSRIHPLTGPQSLTRIDQVATIGAGIGRDIPLVEISPDEFRADVARFIPEDIITMLLDYWSDTVTEPDRVRPGVRDLTGRPGRPLEQWVRDHRPDFTGA